MSLADEDEIHQASSERTELKTLASAISLLQELRQRVKDVLGDSQLKIPLTRLGFMHPEKKDADKAHIMFAGPPVEEPLSGEVSKLKRVCGKPLELSLVKVR